MKLASVVITVCLVVGGLVYLKNGSQTETVPDKVVQVLNGEVGLSDKDNNTTVKTSVGTTVNLKISGTWTLEGSSDKGVLAPIGDIAQVPYSYKCVPGIACFDLQQKYKARARGNADLVAVRKLCGEAYLCPEDEKRFVVHVTVQ